jgi:heme exporter protein D
MTEFLAMGGYGLYVWGSYGVAALCIFIEVFFLNKK